jgi:thymidylate synthase (FAD)
MPVKLIAITKPVIDGIETAEELVAYTARVSNPSNQMNTETAAKLLKYLFDNAHWSPAEMVHITMEIETTRDIMRQILRHRSFSFQEFSQRYADPTKDLGFVTREARLQDKKNRQNSVEVDDAALQEEWEDHQQFLIEQTTSIYDWAIQNGIAKEQARAVLPEGLTVSRAYMAGSLRSWVHYCQLRVGNGTQKEHANIAKECWQIIISNFPSLKNILGDSV